MITIGICYLCIVGVLFSARITLQASTPTSSFYIGAAVEYHPVTTGVNGTFIANKNAENYVKFLKTASEKDVDIIVFPENGLTSGKPDSPGGAAGLITKSSYIPDPKELKVPCHDASSIVMQAVKDISCAAHRYGLYVVINIIEKVKCTGERCDVNKDTHDFYNTNVVFDRAGRIISRYRKYNLFDEEYMNKTSRPELSIFKTDFNVTFGQFICFDILYETPALQLLREKKITDIIFTSHWFSELPFLTSSQIQTSWSFANNVNFLGSGYNSPISGSGGSGIYAGKDGLLGRVWSEKPTNAIVISKIPKVVNSRRPQPSNPIDTSTIYYSQNEITTINSTEPVTQQKLLKDDLKPYKTSIFKPNNGTQNLLLCYDNFCCNFTTKTNYNDALIKDANAKYYRYRFAVFKGVRGYGKKATAGIEVCGLIACTNDNQNSCNERFDINTIVVQPTIFNSIKISGNFTIGLNILRLPISMTNDLQPLNTPDYSFIYGHINKTHASLKYTLTKPHGDLMTFAIYGRNFTADGQPKTSASTIVQSLTPFYLIAVIVAIIV